MTQPQPIGRAASCVRTGLFIKEHLSSVGEDFSTNIHHKLVEALRANNYHHPPTYASFLRYFHHLISFGLIEFSGREEPPDFKGQNAPDLLQLRKSGSVVPSQRRYYRLSSAGMADDEAWHNPAGVRLRKGSY